MALGRDSFFPPMGDITPDFSEDRVYNVMRTRAFRQQPAIYVAAHNTVDELSYMAKYKCDGDADNVEIQAACDDAPHVILLPGDYYLDEMVTTWYDSQHLEGSGIYGTTIYPTAALTEDQYGTKAVFRNGSFGQLYERFRVDARYMTRDGQYFSGLVGDIDGYYNWNVINDVDVRNGGGLNCAGFYSVGDNQFIINSYVQNFDCGIHLEGGNYNTVTNTYIYGCKFMGILMEAWDSKITDCDINWCGAATGGRAKFAGVNSWRTGGIIMGGNRTTLISGNRFYANTHAIDIWSSNSSGHRIVDNSFEQSYFNEHIWLEMKPFQNSFEAPVIIANNTFNVTYDSPAVSIEWYDSTQTEVEHNTGDAVLVMGNHFDGHGIYDTFDNPILYINTRDCRVSNNFFRPDSKGGETEVMYGWDPQTARQDQDSTVGLWSVTGSADLAFDTTYGWNNGSFKFSTTDTSTSTRMQTPSGTSGIPVDSSGSYRLDFWYAYDIDNYAYEDGVSTSQYWYVYMDWYTSGGSFISTSTHGSYLYPLYSSGVGYAFRTFTSPATAAYARIRMGPGITTKSGRNFYFGNFKLYNRSLANKNVTSWCIETGERAYRTKIHDNTFWPGAMGSISTPNNNEEHDNFVRGLYLDGPIFRPTVTFPTSQIGGLFLIPSTLSVTPSFPTASFIQDAFLTPEVLTVEVNIWDTQIWSA